MMSIFPAQIRKMCWFSLDSLFKTQTDITTNNDSNPQYDLDQDQDFQAKSKSESADGEHYHEHVEEQVQTEEEIVEGASPSSVRVNTESKLPQTRSRKRQHQPDRDSYSDSVGVRRRCKTVTPTPQTRTDQDTEELQTIVQGDQEEENNDYVRILRSGKTRLNTSSKKLSGTGSASSRNNSRVKESQSVFTGNHLIVKNLSGLSEDLDFEVKKKMGAIKCTSCDKSGKTQPSVGSGGRICNHFSTANNNFTSLVPSSQEQLCDKCILVNKQDDLSLIVGASEKKQKRVCSYAEAPSYLKFNPYITGGYRSALTPRECVKSLFWWTNETLNIWSHLIGWLFFMCLSVYDSLGLLNLPTTQPWDQIIITLLLVCFQACMLLSALYHVFCCCSEKFYRRWLSADLFGVSLSLLAIYISGIYYAFSCVPFWLNFYLITVGAIFASAMVMQIIPVVVKPTTEEAFHWRLIVFGGWAAYGIVPTFHWALLHGGMSSPVVALLLPRIFWMYAISVAAFIFYVFRLPEKLYPGSVNYIFSSHQLWHLLIVVALTWWHNTGVLYLQFRATNSCEAERIQLNLV